jgi:uroporphyrinogen-III synthase
VSAGHSALVGIGRGDPALLTLRAAELLRAADIVIRDAPIADAILAMIPARAELLASLDDAADVRSAVHAGQRVVWLASDAAAAALETRRLLGPALELEVVPGVTHEAAGERISTGPLSGKRLIVARARPGLSELARRVRDHGGTAIELPHVERVPLPRAALTWPETQVDDVVLLSSVEAAEAWLDSALNLPVIALGNEVAVLLCAAKVPPETTLSGACLESVLVAREHLRGRRVLIPLAENAQTSLADPLAAVGARCVVVPLAPRVTFGPACWPRHIDLVLLPSSLSALALYADAPAHILAVPALAIGPQSATRAARSGARTVHTAAQDTVDALLSSALGLLSSTADLSGSQQRANIQ